jgi:uncharacterized protein
MELTCPKCHGPMRTYERNGVHVDQCSECRGIFLDRGELERLIDAENAWHDGPRAAASAGQHGGSPSGGSGHTQAGTSAGLGAVVNEVISQVRSSKSSSHGSSYGSSGSYGHKKRKDSFLSDLFG